MKNENKYDFVILFFLLILSLCINVTFLYFYWYDYKRWFVTWYCEWQGWEILNNKCVDKKYILELKK